MTPLTTKMLMTTGWMLEMKTTSVMHRCFGLIAMFVRYGLATMNSMLKHHIEVKVDVKVITPKVIVRAIPTLETKEPSVDAALCLLHDIIRKSGASKKHI